jgi:hypothetical protein
MRQLAGIAKAYRRRLGGLLSRRVRLCRGWGVLRWILALEYSARLRVRRHLSLTLAAVRHSSS